VVSAAGDTNCPRNITYRFSNVNRFNLEISRNGVYAERCPPLEARSREKLTHVTQRASIENFAGGYSYVSALGFASAGVAALPGMAIDRVVLAQPVPLSAGFHLVERYLKNHRRPINALCGLELRSPRVVGLEEFLDFNARYLEQLGSRGLLVKGESPLTRTNVVPKIDPPPEPCLYAFSLTTDMKASTTHFVLSGVAELPEGSHYPQDILLRGEVTPRALTTKAVWVCQQLDDTAQSLGVRWDNTTSVHLYTQHPVVASVQREALSTVGVVPHHGLTWHDASPPIRELELEIDIHRHNTEAVVDDV
jgi:hypothetical protein